MKGKYVIGKLIEATKTLDQRYSDYKNASIEHQENLPLTAIAGVFTELNGNQVNFLTTDHHYYLP